MATFYPLTVTDIRRDTRDSVVVTFEAAPGDAEKFNYLQGQYLTLRRTFDGDELRRCYSVCSARAEKLLRIGIKWDRRGLFSTWANEHLKVGDVIEALPPMGNFHAPLEPDKARSYLLFAGGSGITPVLGLIKTILFEEPNSIVTLVYGNRSVNSIMFREELEDLKNNHLGRLSIVHILERDASDIDLFTGRLDADKCAALFTAWVDVGGADLAFICGPEPMMRAVSKSLVEHGLDKRKIKFELFGAAKPAGQSDAKSGAMSDANPGAAETDIENCALTVRLDGTARKFAMPKQGMSVLESALAEKLDVPHSCKAGVCSSCRALVVEGEVEMIANHALEDYEVRQGFVLTCQSYPLTDKLVVDYDK